jgi:hypothetical protein
MLALIVTPLAMGTARCATAMEKSVLKDALESPLLKCPAQSVKGAARVPRAAARVSLKRAMRARAA